MKVVAKVGLFSHEDSPTLFCNLTFQKGFAGQAFFMNYVSDEKETYRSPEIKAVELSLEGIVCYSDPTDMGDGGDLEL